MKQQKKTVPAFDSELQAETERLLRENCDKRELPVSLIRLMLAKANIYHPVVVLYFAAPYCPHNTLQKDDAEYMEKLEKTVRETERETGLSYQICKFSRVFPIAVILPLMIQKNRSRCCGAISHRWNSCIRCRWRRSAAWG